MDSQRASLPARRGIISASRVPPENYRGIVEQSLKLLLSQLAGKTEQGVYTVPVHLVEVPEESGDLKDLRHLVTGLNP